jgi:hypothetical protein
VTAVAKAPPQHRVTKKKNVKSKEAEVTEVTLPLCLDQGLDDRCNSEEAQRNIDPDFNGDTRSIHSECPRITPAQSVRVAVSAQYQRASTDVHWSIGPPSTF